MKLLDALIAIEAQRRDAWLSRNKSALAFLLDEDFLEINYFGRLSKRQILDDLFERLHLEEFSMGNPSLHGIPESPILAYSCFERLSIDGNDIRGDFNVASHFIQRSSGWKILLWQITPARADQ